MTAYILRRLLLIIPTMAFPKHEIAAVKFRALIPVYGLPEFFCLHAWIQHEKLGVMRRQLAFAFFCGVTLIAGGQAVAQAGGNPSPDGSVAKPSAPTKTQGESPQKRPR